MPIGITRSAGSPPAAAGAAVGCDADVTVTGAVTGVRGAVVVVVVVVEVGWV